MSAVYILFMILLYKFLSCPVLSCLGSSYGIVDNANFLSRLCGLPHKRRQHYIRFLIFHPSNSCAVRVYLCFPLLPCDLVLLTTVWKKINNRCSGVTGDTRVTSDTRVTGDTNGPRSWTRIYAGSKYRFLFWLLWMSWGLNRQPLRLISFLSAWATKMTTVRVAHREDGEAREENAVWSTLARVHGFWESLPSGTS